VSFLPARKTKEEREPASRHPPFTPSGHRRIFPPARARRVPPPPTNHPARSITTRSSRPHAHLAPSAPFAPFHPPKNTPADDAVSPQPQPPPPRPPPRPRPRTPPPSPSRPRSRA
jgi:hypothetical protein